MIFECSTVAAMKLHVTYKGGDRDGQSDVRGTPEFPMDLPGGRYVLTFRHAMEESGPTEAVASWLSDAETGTTANASEGS
jgi:hypothetical protein